MTLKPQKPYQASDFPVPHNDPGSILPGRRPAMKEDHDSGAGDGKHFDYKTVDLSRWFPRDV